MKMIQIVLPEPTHQALAGLADLHQLPIEHYCSNLLTELSAGYAGGQRTGGSQDQPGRNSENHVPVGASRVEPQGTETGRPDHPLTQAQLLGEIVAFLKESGGGSPKKIVEQAFFKNHKELFETAYYSYRVGGGVPRWKKNVQFATNAGRDLGVIKLSEDSGRGVWELTDTGKQWQPHLRRNSGIREYD